MKLELVVEVLLFALAHGRDLFAQSDEPGIGGFVGGHSSRCRSDWGRRDGYRGDWRSGCQGGNKARGGKRSLWDGGWWS